MLVVSVEVTCGQALLGLVLGMRGQVAGEMVAASIYTSAPAPLISDRVCWPHLLFFSGKGKLTQLT